MTWYPISLLSKIIQTNFWPYYFPSGNQYGGPNCPPPSRHKLMKIAHDRSLWGQIWAGFWALALSKTMLRKSLTAKQSDCNGWILTPSPTWKRCFNIYLKNGFLPAPKLGKCLEVRYIQLSVTSLSTSCIPKGDV